MFEPTCPGKQHLKKKKTSLAAMHPLQWDLNLDCSELTPGFDLSIKDNPAVSAPLCHWLFSFNAVRSAHTTEWSCKPWLPCCQIVII